MSGKNAAWVQHAPLRTNREKKAGQREQAFGNGGMQLCLETEED